MGVVSEPLWIVKWAELVCAAEFMTETINDNDVYADYAVFYSGNEGQLDIFRLDYSCRQIGWFTKNLNTDSVIIQSAMKVETQCTI